jgi:outer membrane immunogenic protein
MPQNSAKRHHLLIKFIIDHQFSITYINKGNKMKIKLLVAAAATVMASSAMAQSAFQGFYGQIATGYESNTATGLNSPITISSLGVSENIGNISASNQTFGGVPLIAGIGYNFSVAPKWLLGIGIDYSFLTQESSSFSSVGTIGEGGASSASGAKLKASNRMNIFITPGYEIDKDKLVYVKAGYSSIKVDASAPTSVSNADGTSSVADAFGGNLSNTSKTLSGYVVGLGYKQIISKGLYAFGEANYMSYSKANFNSSLNAVEMGIPYSISTNTNAGMNSYQLLVGVGYKF